MAWGLGAAAAANAKKESWADDVEGLTPGKVEAAPPPTDDAAFPSLGEAVKQAPQGGKKKSRGQKMDMRTFMQQAPGPAPVAGRFVAPGRAPMSEKEILLSLPTGSRGRVEGEEEAGPPGGMGGAFRDYGGDRGGACTPPPPWGQDCGCLLPVSPGTETCWVCVSELTCGVPCTESSPTL
eukprot:311159-Pelagomonas_calceolata.AAC.1